MTLNYVEDKDLFQEVIGSKQRTPSKSLGDIDSTQINYKGTV